MNAQAIADHLAQLKSSIPAEQQSAIDEALSLIEEMSEQIRSLRHLAAQRFRRSSEKVAAGQLALAFIAQLLPQQQEKESSQDEAQKPAEKEAAEDRPKRKRRKTRIDLLPVVKKEVRPEPGDLKCSEHGDSMRQANVRVTKQIVYEPAKAYVLEEHVYEYDCSVCEGTSVSGEDTPTLIPDSLASSSLLSHIVVSKAIDTLPIERVGCQLARHGIEIASARLYDWWGRSADELVPLQKEALKRLLLREIISLDDTPFYYKDLDSDDKGLRRGRLWVYVGDRGEVAYCQFTPDWKGVHPRTLLEGYKGIIQGDGYGGIDALFGKPDGPRRAGCADHARRGFVAAAAQGDDRADPIVDLFKVLYAIERRATRASLGLDDLLNLRQEKAVPVWNELAERVQAMVGSVSKKSKLGKAVTYWTNQKVTLRLYLDDARIPISNIQCEQLIRPVALTRKTSLYTGSIEAGRRYATLLTLSVNCTLTGINPYVYFRDTFDHLARGWPARLVGELLPQASATAKGS
jgi:transposase